MLKFWKKKKEDSGSLESGSGSEIQWNDDAKQALNQAVASAPVPGLLRNKVKKELERAAEAAANNAGRTTVTAEDLMAGLMNSLPDHMRKQVEDAAQKGPEGLEELKKKFNK